MSATRIVIAGAGGRMGQTLIRAVAETKDCVLAGALEATGHPDLGADAARLAGLEEAGIALTDDPLPLIAHADALIDFTIPKVSVALAELTAQARIAHVIGTTGCSADDDAKIRAAARHAVIVKSGNMSLGVNMLAALVKQAARALPGRRRHAQSRSGAVALRAPGDFFRGGLCERAGVESPYVGRRARGAGP